MNNPHDEPEIGQQGDDQQDDAFHDFLTKMHRIWNHAEADPNGAANEVRRLFLKALAARANEGDDDEGPANDGLAGPATRGNVPHTQGREDQRLESDAMGLMGCEVPSLRRATADRLTSRGSADVLEADQDSEIQRAINRREAEHLMSNHRAGLYR